MCVERPTAVITAVIGLRALANRLASWKHALHLYQLELCLCRQSSADKGSSSHDKCTDDVRDYSAARYDDVRASNNTRYGDMKSESLQLDDNRDDDDDNDDDDDDYKLPLNNVDPERLKAFNVSIAYIFKCQ